VEEAIASQTHNKRMANERTTSSQKQRSANAAQRSAAQTQRKRNENVSRSKLKIIVNAARSYRDRIANEA
jgi:uncharacterized protein YdaU (DUF1376 family)